MACTRPINGYRSPSGKFFTTPYPGSTFMQVPCGQCVNCRLNHSREWAIRCTHEAQMWDQNCFITLTYNDENLPEGGTLVRKHLTDFFKRLRKHFTGRTIRYFACGEYGSKLQRPHYHVILFNLDFEDKRLYKHGDFPLYNSDTLSRLWPMGFSVLAGFSFESAAYTARYCVKKITGQKAESHYNGRKPEFSAMSLRPGIGYTYFLKYYEDIVNYDKVVSRGGRMSRPPRYYDKLLSGCDLELLERNKISRIDNATYVDPWRLQDLDKHSILKFQKMIRKYENG
ncbi:rolling circle replication-associated protein [Enterobacter cloacae]|uniref:rolling circle replication-associated protein n=1 Tax=Enterobacter cloacae TaxID=550 RepID=UPI003EE31936